MGRTFYVNNSQAPKVMTPNEVLSLQRDGFTQFEYFQSEEDYENAMNSPINEYGVMLMGVEEVSGRGFEFAYDQDAEAYEVHIFTPSTIDDWKAAYDFIGKLATYLGTKVIDEEEDVYDADNITYDYIKDIEFGIKAISDKGGGQFIFGVNYPICLSKEIIDTLNKSGEIAKYFSRFVKNHQHFGSYFSTQNFFYKGNGEGIVGLMSLTEGVSTILSAEYPPFIDVAKYTIRNEDVAEWLISLVEINGDEDDPESYQVIGTLEYQEFLRRIPEEKRHRIDGHYMIIILTKEELKRINAGEPL